MIRWAALALILAPLAASASAPVSPTMTLAEARKLSPQQLAERLLGAAGASGEYVEAKVYGNGGIMIGTPGLNAIELYKRPTSAGPAGLCEVEGVHILFTTSRYDTPGDPPHRVRDFWKVTRFAMLTPTDKRIEDFDEKAQDKACAKLAPVAERTDPYFFTVSDDRPAAADFAMRAVAKAQIAAPGLGAALTCKVSNDDPICGDPARGLAAIPIRRLGGIRVERCADSAGWCVSTTWARSADGNRTHEVGLTIRTDAKEIDPPTEFNVVAVAIDAGTSVDD